ncbi:hypothetical protein TanjilG_09862 [Lupinus angustifolius]|uniref:AB hydrolase-1 domain-containing protein n=1 Tax=Lupinus angustifolius TaxID=3871 RepID=A0A4P1QWV9_LUPAN|nr:hypothetical protein TanjilG_09862 [Lupinus angustifolius]
MFTSLYSGFLRRCFRAAGLSSQSIDLDDKTTLHYWGPTEISKTQKPSLVLIHGFGPMAIWQWRQQVQFFSTHFNAVCVVKLMEKLEVKKFDVVGTSYGGFVAYHLATMLGEERVEKVVIASSGVNMRKSDNVALLERAEMDKIEDLMLPSTPQHLRKLMALSVSSMRFYIPDFFLKDFLNKLYSENRKEKMELLHGLSLGRDDTSIITPLQQEVLIIWGENDQIFPVHKAHELKEVISNNKVKLELIKNASHVPQIEKPAEFNNIILNFLHRTT